jgi:hypothetical protein
MDTDTETLDQAVMRIRMLEADSRKDIPAVPDALHFFTMQSTYYPDAVEAKRKRLAILRQRKAAIRELKRDYHDNLVREVRMAAGKALGYTALRVCFHELRYYIR